MTVEASHVHNYGTDKLNVHGPIIGATSNMGWIHNKTLTTTMKPFIRTEGDGIELTMHLEILNLNHVCILEDEDPPDGGSIIVEDTLSS